MHMPLSAAAHKSGSVLQFKCSDMFCCAVFSGLADWRLLNELCHIVTDQVWRCNGLPGHHLSSESRSLNAGAAALKGTPNLPLV